MRIPRDRDTVEVRLGSKSVHLTNLRKVFWRDGGFTKGDLIQFWAPLLADAGRAKLESAYGAACEHS